jgi:uncharacterized protein with GYD domain
MPYYIYLINWTDKGIRNVKDAPKRVSAARAVVEKAGGKWHGIYYTFGQYDLVSIVEVPNDEAGNVRDSSYWKFGQYPHHHSKGIHRV